MTPAEIEALKELTPFCTVGQLEKLEALIAHGSQRKAAAALGVAKSSLMEAIGRVKQKAAQHMPTLHDYTKQVPDGFRIRGVSQYIGKDGQIAGQWVKSREDDAHRERMIRELCESLCDEVRGRSPLIEPPPPDPRDLCTVYPMGDPHIGLMVWGKEAGADFDLKEAERLSLAAVDHLVSRSPASGTAVILPLGDIFHANDQRNVTPTHGHQLDVDGRFQKVLEVGQQIFKHIILRALEKHSRVVVRFVKGNHDPEMSVTLALIIKAYFHNNPRVLVDVSPSAFWYFRHGACLFGATHGDKVKHQALGGIMSTHCAVDWGQTVHRYWFTGHIHQQKVTELNGVTAEAFRTLAAADAHADSCGYLSVRDMHAIVYDREYGQIERYRADVRILQTAQQPQRRAMRFEQAEIA